MESDKCFFSCKIKHFDNLENVQINIVNLLILVLGKDIYGRFSVISDCLPHIARDLFSEDRGRPRCRSPTQQTVFLFIFYVLVPVHAALVSYKLTFETGVAIRKYCSLILYPELLIPKLYRKVSYRLSNFKRYKKYLCFIACVIKNIRCEILFYVK